MSYGRFLDLRSSPQALAALQVLRQQAAGPFATAHNMGHAPVRSGEDIMRPVPLTADLRQLMAAAIDAHLLLGAAQPFVPPVRMAPQHEAHVTWGIQEICRQRRLATADSGHPTAQLAVALPMMKSRQAAAAQGTGRARDDRLQATIVAAVRKGQTRAQRRVAAARRALPHDRLAWLAAPGHGPLVKEEVTFGQVQQLVAALQRLRADQQTSYKLTGGGLRAVAAAFPTYRRADHLRAAERRILAAQRDRPPQARLDDCLLAEAHAALAMKPKTPTKAT